MAENKSLAEIADAFGLPASTIASILEGYRMKDLELEILILTWQHLVRLLIKYVLKKKE